MTPKEIEDIIQSTIANKLQYQWVYILISAVISVISAFVINYFTTKGQNYATKQDISEITKKIEEVKATFQTQQDIEKLKRQLKHEALLNSLTLIDAHLSHVFKTTEGENRIKVQYATTEEARKCHNNLILTCENPIILKKFISIMFGDNGGSSKPIPLTDQLNEYRNLVRKELGFGSDLILDREKAWFGLANFEAESDKK